MDVEGIAARLLRTAWLGTVRRYNRLEVTVEAPIPDTPCLVVANHGFGGVVDLNVAATLIALDEHTDRPVRGLGHELIWTLGVGGLVERVGGIRANREAALDALDAGYHVLVFPGGDLDAAKPFTRRNDVNFFGRNGFAALAIEADVPIVPVVVAGAGESVLVLSDGTALSRRLGLKRLTRYEPLPVSLSLPWGLNVGAVGLLPYLPLPTKLRAVVLPAVHARSDDDAATLATRVRDRMQATLDDLVDGRLPVVGGPFRVGPPRYRLRP